MKKIIWIPIVSLVLGILSNPPAFADTRITLSTTSSAVLMGTSATFSPIVSGVTDYSNYDWSRFKYEITTAVGRVSDGYVAIWQSNTSVCPGATSAASGSYRLCTSRIGADRTVLSAGTTYAAAPAATAKISVLAGEATVRIRTWIDRNNNNELDPFEPASKMSPLQIIHPGNAKPYLNFQFEPPVLSDQTYRATVTPNGSLASSFTITGLIDPNLLTVKLTQCNFRGCENISGTTNWLSHPQLQLYEYEAAAAFIPRSGYGAQLIYSKTPTEQYVLASRQVDYRGPIIASLSTKLSASGGLVYKQGVSSPNSEPRQKTYLADAGLSTFVYEAQALGEDGKPLENQEVFVSFDTKDIANPENLIVNGSQITTKAVDKVVLARKTDLNGKVILNITYPSHAFLDRIEIETIANGYRSWEYQGGASEEVVTWDAATNRLISLSMSRASSGSEVNRYLTISARVTDKEGRPISGEKVIFGSDFPLIVDEPIVSLATGGASTNIRLGNFVDPQGSAKFYAQILGESGLVTASGLVEWKDSGATLTGSVTNPAGLSSVGAASLGATVIRLNNQQILFSVPGTTQTKGVIFLVNGKSLKVRSSKNGLLAQTKIVHGSNNFEIIINKQKVVSRTFNDTRIALNPNQF